MVEFNSKVFYQYILVFSLVLFGCVVRCVQEEKNTIKEKRKKKKRI